MKLGKKIKFAERGRWNTVSSRLISFMFNHKTFSSLSRLISQAKAFVLKLFSFLKPGKLHKSLKPYRKVFFFDQGRIGARKKAVSWRLPGRAIKVNLVKRLENSKRRTDSEEEKRWRDDWVFGRKEAKGREQEWWQDIALWNFIWVSTWECY